MFGGLFDRTVGAVGAHELFHRITGAGDEPFDPNDPNNLMSLGSMKNQKGALLDDQLAFTPDDLKKLLQNCLDKHRKKQ